MYSTGWGMTSSFWPILVQLGFGVGFAGLILVLSHVISPKLRKKSDARPDTFECGVPYIGDAKGIFNVKFYIIAVLFIVFDIEAIFMFPWAVSFLSFKKVGLGGFILLEMFLFLLVLLVGYFYILKKKGLIWEDMD